MAWVKVSGHRLWAAAGPRSRCRGGVSDAVRHAPGRADQHRACICAAPIPVTTSMSPKKATPKFVGLAYYVDSEDDLKRLAKAPGATGVENIDEPGGGKRVRLTEPNGYQIEVVCGIAPVDRNPGQAAKAQFRRSADRARRRVDAAAQRAGARQTRRPWRADDAAVPRNGRLVPRHAGYDLLRRCLCREPGQSDRLVQSLRSRRRLRRSSRLLLPAPREDRD